MDRWESLRRVALADDFEVVRVFEVFAKRIGETITVPRDELISSVPDSVRTVDGGDAVQELEARADESLSPGASVRAAREMLVLASEDPGLAPVVTDSFVGWKDDQQLVELVLSIGLVGAVWITLASTEISFADGKLRIHKSTATPQQLKAFADVIRAIRGSR